MGHERITMSASIDFVRWFRRVHSNHSLWCKTYISMHQQTASPPTHPERLFPRDAVYNYLIRHPRLSSVKRQAIHDWIRSHVNTSLSVPSLSYIECWSILVPMIWHEETQRRDSPYRPSYASFCRWFQRFVRLRLDVLILMILQLELQQRLPQTHRTPWIHRACVVLIHSPFPFAIRRDAMRRWFTWIHEQPEVPSELRSLPSMTVPSSSSSSPPYQPSQDRSILRPWLDLSSSSVMSNLNQTLLETSILYRDPLKNRMSTSSSPTPSNNLDQSILSQLSCVCTTRWATSRAIATHLRWWTALLLLLHHPSSQPQTSSVATVPSKTASSSPSPSPPTMFHTHLQQCWSRLNQWNEEDWPKLDDWMHLSHVTSMFQVARLVSLLVTVNR